MTTLSIIWAFVKKYWQIAFLVIGALVSFFLIQNQKSNFADNLKKIQDAHDAEIKQIQDARAAEAAQHEANVKKLQDTLDAVQRQNETAKKDHDDKKKKEIAEIVKNYGNKPDELAKQLSAATGFVIVLPN